MNSLQNNSFENLLEKKELTDYEKVYNYCEDYFGTEFGDIEYFCETLHPEIIKFIISKDSPIYNAFL